MYKNILVTVDLDKKDAETKAIAQAVELARTTGATLHLLTVVPNFGLSMVAGYFPEDYEKKTLERVNAALHAFAEAHIPKEIKRRHIVGHGSIYRQILHYADTLKADLIVMSAATPGPEDYLLGPNAARVARHARTSVLVVR